MDVSVIIPAKNASLELSGCLDALSKQSIKPHIYVGDGGSSDDTVRLAQSSGCEVLSINASPSTRRNLLAMKSTDEILAFLDSDCIPHPQWLSRALAYFDREPDLAVLLGPNLTPFDNSLKAHVTGDVLGTFLGGGIARERYIPTVDHETDERSAILCNMFVRRSVFQKVSGFYHWFGGEENSLVYRIKRAGFKVLYSSDVIVYHNRVPLVRPFFRQIFLYARGRGLFIRTCGLNNPFYLLPTAILLAGLFLLIVYPIVGLLLAGSYLLLAALNSLSILKRYESQLLRTLFYLFSSHLVIHIAYAVGLPYGLIRPNKGESRGR